MTIDPNVSHAIARSVPRLVGLIAGSASFLLFGFWLFFAGIVDAGRDIAAVLISPGIFFFGACLLAGVHRLAFGHRFPVKLSPTGFADTRSFRDEIPWSSFCCVSICSFNGQPFIRLELTTGQTDAFDLTWTAMVTQWLNKPFQMEGLYISATDLDTSFDELWVMFGAYAAEFNPSTLIGGPRD